MKLLISEMSLLAGCLLLSIGNVVADVPESNWEAPAQSALAGTTNRQAPMLFIVGDSTVQNSRGIFGWGDAVGRFFNPDKIKVENCAKGGRSSRTFQTQGWWKQILDAAKPGDFVFIQMGPNDYTPLDDTNRARGSIRSVGEETKEIYNPVRKRQETVHTYGWYMRKYVTDARAKGMTPIICSPVPHVPNQLVQPGASEKNDYVGWSAQVAASENAFFINLNQRVMEHYVGMTPEQIKTNYFTDPVHSTRAGAELNAASVIEGLRQLTSCPLKDYLLDQPLPSPSPIRAPTPAKASISEASVPDGLTGQTKNN
jgi:lysophospholipase L1-like esterase